MVSDSTKTNSQGSSGHDQCTFKIALNGKCQTNTHTGDFHVQI
jgi:hypothetical protein